jgi:putative Mg2+ transporter-C (MgtC) family protein
LITLYNTNTPLNSINRSPCSLVLRQPVDWDAVGLHLLAGAGFTPEVFVGTTSLLSVHLMLRPIVQWIESRKKTLTNVETNYRLQVECAADHDTHIRTILLRHIGGKESLNLQGLVTDDSEPNRTVVVADIFAFQKSDRLLEEIVARVGIEPEVKAVSWQRC